jgi:hypothetical protein
MTEKTASMDVTLMDNKNGPDDYGNDGFATLDLGKDRRLAGERGPILGNWKDLDLGGSGNQRQGRDVPASEAMKKRNNQASEPDEEEVDDVPF